MYDDSRFPDVIGVNDRPANPWAVSAAKHLLEYDQKIKDKIKEEGLPSEYDHKLFDACKNCALYSENKKKYPEISVESQERCYGLRTSSFLDEKEEKIVFKPDDPDRCKGYVNLEREYIKIIKDLGKKPVEDRKKFVDKYEEILKNVPIRKKFTKKELSKEIDMSLPRERVHFERYESDGVLESIFQKKVKLHKRIQKAFNAVPDYEGFTTKEIANKHEMPEPKEKLHLEKY